MVSGGSKGVNKNIYAHWFFANDDGDWFDSWRYPFIHDERPICSHCGTKFEKDVLELTQCPECGAYMLTIEEGIRRGVFFNIYNLRDHILEAAQKDYDVSGIVMSEYLRTCDLALTVEEKRYLLAWAGDNEFMRVTDDGEIGDMEE